MSWNNIPNGERLRLWKKLRDDIDTIPLEEKLTEVAKFCGSMPIGSRSMDYYSPSEWPTPWEILFYGTFCTSSISLLMYQTLLLLTNYNSFKIELQLVEDEDVYLIPVINDHFVLNYELGKVSIYADISKEFKLLKRISQDKIKTIT
jgi:hypothetical protein